MRDRWSHVHLTCVRADAAIFGISLRAPRSGHGVFKLCRRHARAETLFKRVDDAITLASLALFQRAHNIGAALTWCAGDGRQHALAGIAERIGERELALAFRCGLPHGVRDIVGRLSAFRDGARNLAICGASRIDARHDA